MSSLSALSAFNEAAGHPPVSIDHFETHLREQGLDLTDISPILRAPKDRNRILNACAGAGKTTVMCVILDWDNLRGLSRKKEVTNNGMLLEVNEPVVALTFLNKAKKDMESRFSETRHQLEKYLGRGIDFHPRFATFHADYYDFIKEYTGTAPKIISEGYNSKLFQDSVKKVRNNSQIKTNMYLDEITFEQWNALESAFFMIRDCRPEEFTFRSIRPFIRAYMEFDYTFLEEADQLFNSGVGPQEMSDAIVNRCKPIIQRILHLWKTERINAGVKDFHDLQDDVFDLLGAGNVEHANPRAVRIVKSRYKHLYIDEFQDISTIQYCICKAIYTIVDGTVMVVGDDDQAIYSWRGGDVRAMTDKAPRDFDMLPFFLTKNWRCPANILEPIKVSIEQNPASRRVAKNIVAAKPGGEVYQIHSEDLPGQAELVNDLVKEEYTNNKMSVAILARKNNTLILPALMSIYRNPGIVMEFVKTSSTKLPATYQGMQDFTDFLAGGTNGFKKEGLAGLRTIFKWQALNDLNEAIKRDNADISMIKPQISTISGEAPDEKMKNELKLAHFIKDCQARLNEYSTTAGYLQESLVQLYKQNEKGRFVPDALKSCMLFYIQVIGDCIKKAKGQQNPDEYAVSLFLAEIRRVGNALESDRPFPKVTFSTVHSFKGREADVAVLLSDNDNEFLLDESATVEDFIELRKVHYIAGTRAKKKMFYSLVASQGSPSAFFKEMVPQPPVYMPDLEF